MADFLDEKRKEIQARLKELKPLVDEYNKSLLSPEAIAAAEDAKRKIIAGAITVVDAMFQ